MLRAARGPGGGRGGARCRPGAAGNGGRDPDGAHHRGRSRGAAVARVVTVARLSPLAGGRGVKFAGQLDTPGFDGDGSPAAAAQLSFPSGLAVDARGRLLIADSGNRRIRRVDISPSRVITTLAGNGTLAVPGEGVPATSAPLPFPGSAATDLRGNVYVTTLFEDRGDSTGRANRRGWPYPPVRRIDDSRLRGRRRAGHCRPSRQPPRRRCRHGRERLHHRGLPRSQGRPARHHHHLRRRRRRGLLRRRRPRHRSDAAASDRDRGRPARRRLRRHGQRVRKITPNGIITTVAGNGTATFSGDGGPAAHAGLAIPLSVAADGAGNVYIGDGTNDLRASSAPSTGRHDPTIAGMTGSRSSDHLRPATETSSCSSRPGSLDTRGDLFISDRFSTIIPRAAPPLTPPRQAAARTRPPGSWSNASISAGSRASRRSQSRTCCAGRSWAATATRCWCRASPDLPPSGGWVVFRKVGRSWLA